MVVGDREGVKKIAFFTKVNKMMVILSAKDKPKLYEKGLKKTVDKEIEKWLNEAEEYMNDFIKNPASFFPFNI